MECLYIVFSPHNEAAPNTCLVVFKYGTELKKGQITFDNYPFDVPEALAAIDAAQHLATDWCSERQLADAAREEDSPAKAVPTILRAMERSIGNMVDEAVGAIPMLERLLKRDQLDEMEGDLSNAHFQLKLRNEIPVFSALDMILYRGFPSGGSVRVNCVYEEVQSSNVVFYDQCAVCVKSSTTHRATCPFRACRIASNCRENLERQVFTSPSRTGLQAKICWECRA